MNCLIHSYYLISKDPQSHPAPVSSSVPPQHPLSPHVTSLLPVRAALIMAWAQPTPASTVMAPSGQFLAHAPHSMQFSGLWIDARRSCMEKTPCGQTSVHLSQPIHLSGKNLRVFSLYELNSFISPHPEDSADGYRKGTQSPTCSCCEHGRNIPEYLLSHACP
jgi:hypothetical protein